MSNTEIIGDTSETVCSREGKDAIPDFVIRWADASTPVLFSNDKLSEMAGRYDFDAGAVAALPDRSWDAPDGVELLDADGNVAGWVMIDTARAVEYARNAGAEYAAQCNSDGQDVQEFDSNCEIPDGDYTDIKRRFGPLQARVENAYRDGFNEKLDELRANERTLHT